MIKSKEIAGPSCLTSARDDEPLFVLRANDEIAPLVVRFWATQYHKLKTKQPGGMTKKQHAKLAEAVAAADVMHRWRLKNAITSVVSHPVESVEKVIVDGEVKLIGVDPAEPQRVGDEVLSGCAVRAARQIERADRIELSAKQFQAMERVCTLAIELCNAMDAAGHDIGGHRPARDIFAELGPACDAYEGR